MYEIFFPLFVALSVFWYDGSYIVVNPPSSDFVIIAPDGTELTTAVYQIDGRLEAKIRPTMTGTYTYDGQSVYVAEIPPAVEFRHGAGSPENLLACESFPNTPNAKYADCYQFIDEANELGLNALYMILMNIGGDGQDVSPYWFVRDWSGQLENNNLTFDEQKLYLWQDFMETADRAGIELYLVLGEAEEENKRELDNGTLGPERMAYYNAMVSWFGHLNPVWVVSEEYDGDWAISDEEVLSWACYLKSIGAGRVAIHNASQNIASIFSPFVAHPCIDVLAVQYWYESTSGIMNWFNLATNYPVVLTEPYTIDLTTWERHCELKEQARQQGAYGYFLYSGNYDNNLESFYWLADGPCE